MTSLMNDPLYIYRANEGIIEQGEIPKTLDIPFTLLN